MTNPHHRFTPSSKIVVRASPGKGRGVFTTRKIRAGEVIEEAPVLLVPRDQNDTLANTFLAHYMFQTDNGKRYVIALGLVSMLNHGDDANAEFFVSSDMITIKATRAISSNAEVTVDYGWRGEEWRAVGVDPQK